MGRRAFLFIVLRAEDSRLANVSSRGFVQTGEGVMIGGVTIGGVDPQRTIIRAIGPSLSFSGKLEDPLLKLFDGNGSRMAANDHWKETQEAEITATTIPPSGEREAAVVWTLPRAAYTAVVRGAGETTGVALVEAYALD